MSPGTSLSQVLQVIITELTANAGAPCTRTYTRFTYATHLYFINPQKAQATLPRNPTDLRAAGAGLIEVPLEPALCKSAIALLRKGFRSYIHCDEDLWIYFP